MYQITLTNTFSQGLEANSTSDYIELQGNCFFKVFMRDVFSGQTSLGITIQKQTVSAESKILSYWSNFLPFLQYHAIPYHTYRTLQYHIIPV